MRVSSSSLLQEQGYLSARCLWSSSPEEQPQGMAPDASRPAQPAAPPFHITLNPHSSTTITPQCLHVPVPPCCIATGPQLPSAFPGEFGCQLGTLWVRCRICCLCFPLQDSSAEKDTHSPVPDVSYSSLEVSALIEHSIPPVLPLQHLGQVGMTSLPGQLRKGSRILMVWGRCMSRTINPRSCGRRNIYLY